MSKGMLGNLSLAVVRGPRNDLDDKLAGENGEKWLRALNRFLRMENSWPEKSQQMILTSGGIWHRGVNDTAIDVNLDALPKLPFHSNELRVMWDSGSGLVRVELIDDDLVVDGKKVVLHFEPEKIEGDELRRRLSEQPTLHPNILDAIFENQHLIPESWKERGHISFWAVGFVDYKYNRPDMCIRYLTWSDVDCQWKRSYGGLGALTVRYPAAVLAS